MLQYLFRVRAYVARRPFIHRSLAHVASLFRFVLLIFRLKRPRHSPLGDLYLYLSVPSPCILYDILVGFLDYLILFYHAASYLICCVYFGLVCCIQVLWGLDPQLLSLL
jgi:hypothetical protein